VFKRVAVLTIFLAIAAAFAPARGQARPSDALKFLDEVTRQYAEAGSYHIESITETRVSTELTNYWIRELLRAEKAPGKKYRYEGQRNGGSGILVSDGTTEWQMYRSYSQYVKRLPGSYNPYSKVPATDDARVAEEAFFLRSNLATIADSAKSAHFERDAKISVNGHRVSCFVVTFGSEDLRRKPPASQVSQTFWIDKVRRVIVKQRIVSDYDATKAAGTPLKHVPVRHTEMITTYPVTELDKPIPDSDFAFAPPADASLVAELPPPYGVISTRTTESAKPLPNMIGKMEPSATYYAPDGSPFRLNSLLGHPVLIDLWASWCGPCLKELPKLDAIHKKTKEAGLVVIGFDLDSEAGTAAEFLKRKGYDWPDYHILANEGYGLPNTVVPLHVLIDKDGKILYYHDGLGDEAGLIQAIQNLGPAYSAALAHEN
jgi:thiol-disulfide isomerase/thioredoxin